MWWWFKRARHFLGKVYSPLPFNSLVADWAYSVYFLCTIFTQTDVFAGQQYNFPRVLHTNNASYFQGQIFIGYFGPVRFSLPRFVLIRSPGRRNASPTMCSSLPIQLLCLLIVSHELVRHKSDCCRATGHQYRPAIMHKSIVLYEIQFLIFSRKICFGIPWIPKSVFFRKCLYSIFLASNLNH